MPVLEASSRIIEVQLPAMSLEIGMHVTRLDRPWTEVPVLIQGLTIDSQDDIDMLQEHCKHVFIEIDEEFWKDSVKDKPETPAANAEKAVVKEYPGLVENKDIHEELPRAKLTLQATHDHVEKVFDDIGNGDAFNFEASRKAVKSCVTSIMSNANALLWLTKIQDQDKYTTEHSMRVGILAIAFGRFLGVPESDLELLGLCGMLHDVGKARVPPEILHKPGKLTRIEYEIMKEHALLGKQILDEAGGVTELIKMTAQSHHERIDGKGYPEQLDAGRLHKYIRMVSIVDVYDAITSERPYKEGRPAFDALKILFAECDKHFDKELVEAFIRMIGLYPTGTLVEMLNGEVGIVVASNPNMRLRPKVELVLTSDKQRRKPYVVDLADDVKDKNGDIYAIKEGVSNGTYGVDVKDYISG